MGCSICSSSLWRLALWGLLLSIALPAPAAGTKAESQPGEPTARRRRRTGDAAIFVEPSLMLGPEELQSEGMALLALHAKKLQQTASRGSGPDARSPSSPDGGNFSSLDAGNSSSASAGAAGMAEAPSDVIERMRRLTSIFWFVLPLVFGGSVLFELLHRGYAGIDLSKPALPPRDSEDGQAVTSTGCGEFLSGLWPFTKLFLLLPTTRATLPLFVVLSVFSLFLDWCLNRWNADFWNSIQNKELNQFWTAMFLFMQLAATKIVTAAYSGYIASMMGICWRTAITQNLQERWLMGRAFYAAGFPQGPGSGPPADNPDQRLQEDADLFVDTMLGMATSFSMSVGRLLVFLPVLWVNSPAKAFGVVSIPGWLAYMAVAYSLFGSIISHIVGQKLIPLNFYKQRKEADYRHAAVQVRDNAQSVSLYGAEAVEHARLTRRFTEIQRVVWEQMRIAKYLSFFTLFYSQLGIVFPWTILAPNFFGGTITLGSLMQVTSAMGHVQGALDWFVDRYPVITQLRATADRLWGFSLAVGAASEKVLGSTIQRAEAHPGAGLALSAHGVRVELPGGRALWEDAALEVKKGERVLLLGPDGCGKSVFLRAIAGCWPARGTADFSGDGALFVPQKPFIPAGTLHAAVAYPEAPEAYSEVAVRGALRAVCLDALAAAPLGDEGDWQRRLSGGELQRLALAHALLRRPGVLLLDEATSAVSEAGAADLYAALAEHLPKDTAIVSIDHDANAKVGPTHQVHMVYDAQARCWVRK